MDPLVDDSVAMAKKLKELGNSVGLNVLSGLPHGFLNMIHVKISISIQPNHRSYLFEKKIKFFHVFRLIYEFSENSFPKTLTKAAASVFLT